MNIEVYTLCYNEEILLPFFLRHYQQYASKIVVFNNYSTDSTFQIAKAAGCDVRMWDTGNQVRDDLMLELKNNCWKESRGKGVDWAIVVDVDEFVYHPDLINVLHRLNIEGKTVCTPAGYQMISKEMPPLNTNSQIYEHIKTGLPSKYYTKSCIISPDAISELHYSPGCHVAKPTGVVHACSGGLKLLHYNKLSAEYFTSRMLVRHNRLSDINLKMGWGRQYNKTAVVLLKEYAQALIRARCVIL